MNGHWSEISPDRRMFAAGTGHRVAAIRAGLAVIIALRIALGPYRRLAQVPDAAFQPPLVLELLQGFPSWPVIVAIQVVGTLAAVAVLVGWRPRLTFVTAWVSLLVLAGLRDSLGKLLHNDVMLLLAGVPFLLAPAEARWGQHVARRRDGWPPRMAMVLISGCYWFAGIQKLVHSGTGWVTGDNLRWVMYSAALLNSRVHETATALFIADHPCLAHLTAAAILGFELGFPVVLVWSRLRPWVITAAVLLHIGTWLTLGLDYWAWSLTVAVVLWNWDGRAKPDAATADSDVEEVERRPGEALVPASGDS